MWTEFRFDIVWLMPCPMPYSAVSCWLSLSLLLDSFDTHSSVYSSMYLEIYIFFFIILAVAAERARISWIKNVKGAKCPSVSKYPIHIVCVYRTMYVDSFYTSIYLVKILRWNALSLSLSLWTNWNAIRHAIVAASIFKAAANSHNKMRRYNIKIVVRRCDSCHPSQALFCEWRTPQPSVFGRNFVSVSNM